MNSSQGYKGIARGYVRVSTQGQADSGISLQTQKARIEEHCRSYNVNLNLIKIYEDAGISAKDMNRPALLQLLEEIKSGETLIVCDLSRFSRSMRDAINMLGDLHEKGVKFCCLSSRELDFGTPMGEIVFGVLMLVHQLERRNTSAHVSHNLQQLSKEGRLRGKPPFGYKFVSKYLPMQPDEDQQTVMAKIRKLHEEKMPMAAIARKLNDDGDCKCLQNGKRNGDSQKSPIFHTNTIRRILVDMGLIGQTASEKRKPVKLRIQCHKTEYPVVPPEEAESPRFK